MHAPLAPEVQSQIEKRERDRPRRVRTGSPDRLRTGLHRGQFTAAEKASKGKEKGAKIRRAESTHLGRETDGARTGPGLNL
jgi:hypothetical protein